MNARETMGPVVTESKEDAPPR